MGDSKHTMVFNLGFLGTDDGTRNMASISILIWMDVMQEMDGRSNANPEMQRSFKVMHIHR